MELFTTYRFLVRLHNEALESKPIDELRATAIFDAMEEIRKEINIWFS